MQAIHAGYPCRLYIQATPAKPSIFWKKYQKLCQKMRLDALIIFPVEWRQNIVILIGKQSKYCREVFDIKTEKMRRDALIIFPIEWRHNIVILIGKRSKYCREFFDVTTEKMRRDALIIFPIEWRHNIVILIRKRSKYCKLSFMSAIHAGYPCRPSLQPIHSGYASETDHFLKKCWKHCQKMRPMDASGTVFEVSWQQHLFCECFCYSQDVFFQTFGST